MIGLLVFVLLLIVILSSVVDAQTVYPGSWEILVEKGGVSAMHMTTTYKNTVVMYDRTDYGASELLLPKGRCRDDPKDLALTHDCWAHSIEYNIATKTLRPLMVMTDTWCSSGAFAANGTLVSTGGYNDGGRAVRSFVPCSNSACDWDDSDPTGLQEDRWYASNQILPDNRIIVVGGLYEYSYEFVPGGQVYTLPFLQQTTTPGGIMNNLYPFLHLSSDGNLFIFANRDSILLDYKTNRVVKTFPTMPDGPRNYPSSGSSVMLPLWAADGFKRIEILICGGAPANGYYSATISKNYLNALQSCGRIVITDPNPVWAIENMPEPRVMGDMLILPNGEILIINGAQNGVAGWLNARNPALAPYLYRPSARAGKRFTVLAASTIPRLYHSSTNVWPDGRIFVGGSNPNYGYAFTGVLFPTELRLEAYSPYYLDKSYSTLRATILGTDSIRYGLEFRVWFSVSNYSSSNIQFSIYAPSFTTHGTSMNQRLLMLATARTRRVKGIYIAKVTAPPDYIAAPRGYYMLFLVNHGIPSVGKWILLD